MKKIIIISVLIFCITGGAGLWYYQNKASTTISSNEIQRITVTRGDIESLVTAQGTLEPKDYVDVGAQVSGLITKMHVEIGDRVEIGDLIAEIDPEVYEAQVRADEAKIKQLEAQKAEQEALIKQAQWKYERNVKLYEDKAVSKEVLEDAEITLEVAKASLLSLEAQLEEAVSGLEGDQTNLGYTTIYSPMRGSVVDESVQEGQTINANQTTPTIVQVADLETMTAKAEVAEADVMKLKEGMPAYFTTLGSGERRWSGTVRQILPTPEEINDVVLYNVLVDVNNKDKSLLPGMTTQMFFILAEAKDALVIPVSALGQPVPDKNTDTASAYKIKALNKNGQPEERIVLISLTDRTQAAIESGLEEDDIVIKTNKATEENQDRGPPGMRIL